MPDDERIDVAAPGRSHLPWVLRGLLKVGWRISWAPAGGRLPRNGLLMTLKSASRDIRVRLFVYKVTGSSRGLPNERRIEITSTYQNGRIDRLKDFQDIVLGFDTDRELFVGVDSRRIEEGGPTGNASSFFEKEGLNWSRANEILIRQHSAKLFQKGVEFHAFFKPQCIAEYLFNSEAIHNGTYLPSQLKIKKKAVDLKAGLSISLERTGGDMLVVDGSVLPRDMLSARNQLVTAYESGDTKTLRKRKISQQTLLEIKLRCEENGRLGEEFVLDLERKRLRRSGTPNLADNVKWVSPDSACEGYDILSYEQDGTERFIEVKSTSGTKYVFEMSNNEWKVSTQRKDQYFIYRVTKVRQKPQCKIFGHPADLEEKGLLIRTAAGWLITLK